MGLESMIKNIPRKRLELYKNLVSTGVIFVIAYAAIVLAGLRDPLDFFKTSAFMNVFLALLFLSIVWKILNGGKINVPNTGNKQQKPVKKQYQPKQSKSYQQPKKSTQSGSWQCPKCNSYVIGNECPKCGNVR